MTWKCVLTEKQRLLGPPCASETGGRPGTLHRDCGYSTIREEIVERLWSYCGSDAGEAFDAVLEVLAERADGWTDLAWRNVEDPPQPDNPPWGTDFIEVLR